MKYSLEFEEDIKNAIKTLNSGGTILYPTDTVWGIGCDATNEAAVNKVFDIKQRPKEKSLIILLAEAKDVLQYSATPHPDIIAIVESFEQPTTVIYDHALNIADTAIHENGSIAIRVTKDPFCRALLKRFQKPIISTSANISGANPATDFASVSTDIKNSVDYVVRHRQNDTAAAQASRIVTINADGSLNIIRG